MNCINDKSFFQMLDDLTTQNGFGSPIYQLFSYLHEGLQMFTYKVSTFRSSMC